MNFTYNYNINVIGAI